MNRNISIISLPGRALRSLAPLSLISLLALLVLFSATAFAQLSGNGAVAGTVEDATGAAIPNATVAIKSNRTGIATTVRSTGAGDYTISTLDPGIYTITVSAAGFQTLTQQHVQVNALETVTFDPKLPIGTAEQTVTVTTAPPQLQTTNAQLGATLENDMYSALPIEMGANGQPDQRRASDFAALLPGVQFNETNGNATTNTGVVNGSGSRGAASAVYIDGVPFTNGAGEGDPRFVWTAISVDAVDQFQVETSGYPALYEGQGVENFNIKQGGNKYHAAVYEFFRNTALDSWGFYKSVNPVTNLPEKPVEHQNEYGIILSGPLVPFGAWKDKLFFFGNYDGFRYLHDAPAQITFPNSAEQAGNFQGIAPIYDPGTQTACTANNTNATNKTCRYEYGYVYGGTPGLNGNPVLGPGGLTKVDVIPTSGAVTNISPIAQKLQSQIPTLANQNPTNNYVGQNSSALSNWSMTDRIDYNISQKDILSLTAALGRQASSVPVGQTTAGRNVGPLPYNYAQAYAPKTAVGIIEETHTFSNSLLNQFKYGFARYNSPGVNADNNPAYAATAVYGYGGLPAGQAAGSFPIVTFAGVDAPTGWAGDNANTGVSNSYTLIDNLQWVKGRHTLTAGIDLAWIQYNYFSETGGSSPVTLANAITETEGFTNASSAPTVGGVSYASFLIGQIDSGKLTQNGVAETGARFRPVSPYIQDNWKVTSRLTLDLGLRWDYYPTYTEAHNVLSFFDPTLTNTVTNSPGALRFAGSGAGTCNCSTNVNNYFKNFGPRVGFAFQSDPKTVWRGSYGVMYTHGNGVGGSAVSRQGTGTLGFSAAPSFAATGSYQSSATLAQGFPAYTAPAGVASGHNYGTGYTNVAGYTGTPQSASYGDPVYGGRAPQYINYTFGLQHQWTPNFVTTMSYVGSEGHFLIADGSNADGFHSDQLDPKYLALGSCLGTKVSSLSAACIAQVGALGGTIPAWFLTSQTLAVALTPFPEYSVSNAYDNTSNSSYNALQISAQKRYFHGVTFMVNYTWSRVIDDGGTFRTGYAIPAAYSNDGRSWKQDAIERSVSTSNQPHHFVFTGVEDLPFGHGSLGGGHAWTRALLGGFKFSQIVQMASGSPLAINAATGQINQAAAAKNATATPIEPNLNPSYIGNARATGRWSGFTPNIVASAGNCTTSAPTGPFINPVSTCLNTAYAPSYTFGNAPRTAPYGLTGPGLFDLDISLRRSFPLHLGESSRLNLQADLYNVTNYVQFSGIGVTLGSGGFGVPTSQYNNPRAAQLSARLEF